MHPATQTNCGKLQQLNSTSWLSDVRALSDRAEGWNLRLPKEAQQKSDGPSSNTTWQSVLYSTMTPDAAIRHVLHNLMCLLPHA